MDWIEEEEEEEGERIRTWGTWERTIALLQPASQRQPAKSEQASDGRQLWRWEELH